MKSRDIYNKTYENEIQNENDHFLKIEPVTSTATINEGDTISTTGGNTTTIYQINL